MNHQTAFNQIFNGLKSQGFQKATLGETTWRKGELCLFKTVDGLKCAIGHLFDDDQIRRLDAMCAGESTRWAYIQSVLGTEIRMDFIEEIRLCHNDALSPNDMQEKLTAFAAKWGLNIPMDMQTAFNRAYNGLRNQQFEKAFIKSAVFPEWSVSDVCQFEMEDGKKCAIGHVINETNERIGHWRYVSRLETLEKELSFAFVNELRNCHNLALTPEGMEQNLLGFAEKWKLVVPA